VDVLLLLLLSGPGLRRQRSARVHGSL